MFLHCYLFDYSVSCWRGADCDCQRVVSAVTFLTHAVIYLITCLIVWQSLVNSKLTSFQARFSTSIGLGWAKWQRRRRYELRGKFWNSSPWKFSRKWFKSSFFLSFVDYQSILSYFRRWDDWNRKAIPYSKTVKNCTTLKKIV